MDARVTKERPILFQGAMVRAILAGTKSQTRRPVKGLALEWLAPGMFTPEYVALPENGLCPYGHPGDRLWVREAWAQNSGTEGGYLYRADHGGTSGFYKTDLKTGLWTHACHKWRPSIHMPRAASRIALEITDVRVELLQDISESDANAEGCDLPSVDQDWSQCRRWYQALWESINGPGSWDANPWVWAVSFRRAGEES
jgi:hypothetical protein